MKWNSREPVWFDDKKYKEKVKDMDPDALWMRECLKYRTKVSSACSITFSGLLVIPTLGLATGGLCVSGRTLDIARRKVKIIRRELDRRNLPHYHKKKRDVLIPLGISTAVIVTIGVIELLCLAGTSSGILHGSAAHAVSALGQDPGQFMTAAGHGIEFQAQQLFHIGGHSMAVSGHVHALDSIGVGSCMPAGVHESACQLAVPNVSLHLHAGLLPGTSGSNAITSTVSPHFEASAASSILPSKFHLATQLHTQLAAHAGVGSHAAAVQSADAVIEVTALQGFDATGLAGEAVGMGIAQSMEEHIAQFLIADTGLQSAWTSIKSEVIEWDDKNSKVVESDGEKSEIVESDDKSTNVFGGFWDDVADNIPLLLTSQKKTELPRRKKVASFFSPPLFASRMKAEKERVNGVKRTDKFSEALTGGVGSHAAAVQSVDDVIEVTASEGCDTAELAAEAVGMGLAQHTAQSLIPSTGLQSEWTSIKADVIELDDKNNLVELDGKNSEIIVESDDKSTKVFGGSPDDVAKKIFSEALTGGTPRVFSFLSKSRQPISQRIITLREDLACNHSKVESLGVKCRFCLTDISVEASSYYHCCLCSDSSEAFNICEICVAGRGCSCSYRDKHILRRKGRLAPDVEFGNLKHVNANKWHIRSRKR